MSSDLYWMIIKDNSSFLRKGRNIKQTFTVEPNNLASVNSYRFNGFIHSKTIGIVPSKDDKGVVVVTKTRQGQHPSKMYASVEMKREARRTLNSIRSLTEKNGYRKDLKVKALRRASALMKSQKPVLVKSRRSRRKNN